MRRSVTCAHEASYPDPIHVTKGEVLTLTGREDTADIAAFGSEFTL